MNVYLMTTRTKAYWVIAVNWTEAFNAVAEDDPEADVISTKKYNHSDDSVLTETAL